MYSVYSKFDVDQHKQKYINYLEVIILESGQVEYAVPSHQEYLINYCMKKLGITDRQQFYDLCPKEYHFNYMEWLCMTSGCVAVSNDYKIGNPNNKQLETLRMLKEKGVYEDGHR